MITYGVLEKQTVVTTKVGQKSIRTLKINTDKIEEKPIFKKNFNF